MILKPEMPTTGQFIAVWENNGEIWADTHKYINGTLHMLTSQGEWQPCNPQEFYDPKQALFLLKD